MSKHFKLQILGAATVLTLSAATLPALAATVPDGGSTAPQRIAKTTDGSLRLAMNSKRQQVRIRHQQKAFVPKANVYTSGRRTAPAAAADGDNGVQDFKDFLNSLCPWGQPNC